MKWKNVLDKFPDEFKQGYRGILLLHRPKDGGKNFPQRKGKKKINSTIEEWNEIVSEFLDEAEKSELVLRIYASVNASINS